jgi:hypothetical protein
MDTVANLANIYQPEGNLYHVTDFRALIENGLRGLFLLHFQHQMMAGKVDPKLLTLVQLVSSGISLEQHDSSLEETFNLCNEYFYSDVLFSNYHSLKNQNGFTISLLKYCFK